MLTERVIKNLDDGFGHWLAGFIDGEGCFIIRNITHQGALDTFACTLRVSVRDDELSTIEEIIERTGIGKLHRSTSRRANWNPQVQWSVQNKRDCLVAVEIFDRYPLRAKKKQDYAIWREAVLAWQGVIPGRVRHDWTRIAAMKDELAAGRQYQAVAA